MANTSEFSVGPRLGFVGVGTMNCAIIEGLLKLPTSGTRIIDHFSLPIFVSPRGSVKVAGLFDKHGNQKIHIRQNNQEVLDLSDVIFIGVRPEQVKCMIV